MISMTEVRWQEKESKEPQDKSREVVQSKEQQQQPQNTKVLSKVNGASETLGRRHVYSSGWNGSCRRRAREKSRQKIFKETMVENSPNLIRKQICKSRKLRKRQYQINRNRENLLPADLPFEQRQRSPSGWKETTQTIAWILRRKWRTGHGKDVGKFYA